MPWQPLSPDRGTVRLATLVEEARALARRVSRPVVVSLVEPAPEIDPLTAIECAIAADGPAGTAMFWSRPDEEFTLAGLGSVVTLSATGEERFERIDADWRHLLEHAVVDDPVGATAAVGPLLMGGFSFEPGGPATARWEGFGAGQLTLPRVLLTIASGERWLTTTLLVDPASSAAAELAVSMRLRAMMLDAAPGNDLSSDPAPQALRVTDERPAGAWQELVRRAAGETAARESAMQKVVLARSVHVASDRVLSPTAALRQLEATFSRCYVFGRWAAGRAFIGASPERLARLEGDEVRSSSLAGSIARGATAAEDAALAAELFASAKDRAEHAMVREALCEWLADVCEDVTAPTEPAILTLPHVHHLLTPVRASLRDGRSLLAVVGRIHPTPAVGGWPRATALEFIREHEGLDRGWYASPIGWVGRREGEFAVGLRSGLVAGREAWLFAGCGVVADSDPVREYEESLLKLRPMHMALASALEGEEAEPLHVRAAAGVATAR